MCDLYEEESPFKPCPICGARAFDNSDNSDGQYLQCGGEKSACPLAGYTVPVELWEALPRRLGSKYEERAKLPYLRREYDVAHRVEPASLRRHVCPVCKEPCIDVVVHMAKHHTGREVTAFEMPYTAHESYYLHNGLLYRR